MFDVELRCAPTRSRVPKLDFLNSHPRLPKLFAFKTCVFFYVEKQISFPYRLLGDGLMDQANTPIAANDGSSRTSPIRLK